ncbi:hypothetical protein [Nonomuraea sp. NPDC049400]|uniref:hypothetical protein n=1 Tax=Nonomuraea sp. NPDC049400 TaxID=3364352 RepID=UPI0037BC3848
MYDGLLRPLTGAGPWLDPAAPARTAVARPWRFTPLVEQGREAAPGTAIGRVEDAGSLAYLVLSRGGEVSAIRQAGRV